MGVSKWGESLASWLRGRSQIVEEPRSENVGTIGEINEPKIAEKNPKNSQKSDTPALNDLQPYTCDEQGADYFNISLRGDLEPTREELKIESSSRHSYGADCGMAGVKPTEASEGEGETSVEKSFEKNVEKHIKNDEKSQKNAENWQKKAEKWQKSAEKWQKNDQKCETNAEKWQKSGAKSPQNAVNSKKNANDKIGGNVQTTNIREDYYLVQNNKICCNHIYNESFTPLAPEISTIGTYLCDELSGDLSPTWSTTTEATPRSSPQNIRPLKRGSSSPQNSPQNVCTLKLSCSPIVDDRPLHDDFDFCGTILGEGANGPVRLIRSRASGRSYAFKTVREMAGLTPADSTAAAEGNILLKLDHPNIVKLHYIYQTSSLVFERFLGEDLLERLKKRQFFSENDARYILRQMVSSIAYIHSKGVVHRDLKLENWFISEENDENGNGVERVKLLDFGFARRWDGGEPMTISCGSPSYISPEALNGSYTNSCDVWGLGLIAYALLLGKGPFSDISEKKMAQRIKKGAFSVGGEKWDRISSAGKNFIFRLLTPSAESRITAEEALNHEWIRTENYSSIPGCITLASIEKYVNLEENVRNFVSLLALNLTTSLAPCMNEIVNVFLQLRDGATTQKVLEHLQIDADKLMMDKSFSNVFGESHRWTLSDLRAVALPNKIDEFDAIFVDIVAIHARIDGDVVSMLKKSLRVGDGLALVG